MGLSKQGATFFCSLDLSKQPKSFSALFYQRERVCSRLKTRFSERAQEVQIKTSLNAMFQSSSLVLYRI